MTKFHINKQGIPSICKAKPGNCPLGDNSTHFNSSEEAQLHINKINQEKFSILPASQINLDDKLKNKFDEKHLAILSRLNKANFEAYFVGGSLRDAVIDLPINDVDITTSATPDEIISIFSDYKVLPIGIEHGTVAIIMDGEQIEITTFRHDGEYSDGRRPDEVTFTTSLKEDLQRRDFTINALAYNSGGLVDLVGGLDDIDSKLIRAVGAAEERFQEDPLRIMRGLRFASKLGFNIEKETERAIFENKHLLKNISAERLQQEFNGLLMGNNAREVLTKYSSVISEFIPEIEPMIGFDQKNPYHLHDVWEHSTVVVENTKDDIAHKLAGIFHDSGKPLTYVEDDEGVGHFLGHAEESMKIAEQAMTRLRYSNKEKQKVLDLIEDHDGNLSTKKYKIAKRIYEVGPERYLDSLDFIRADDKGKNLAYRNRFDKLDKMEKIAKDYLADNPILSHKDLAISPKDIIDLGFQGKAIKEALDKTALLAISGHKNERESQIEYLKKHGLE